MASYDLKTILGEKLKRLTDKTLKALVDCMCTVGASLCSLDKRVSALESVELPKGGYKPMQEPVSSPSASGTAIQFIESMEQDATGRMTVTKKTVRTGSTSQTGVVQLTDSHSSTSTNTAATPKNVKEAYDLANGKTDKVRGATSGNFAGLDGDGNLTDSGLNASDFATAAQGAKADAALPTSVITVAYNLNNSIETAVEMINSQNLSNAPLGETGPAGLIVNKDSVWIRQLFLGDKGLYLRNAVHVGDVVEWLRWQGPFSTERTAVLEYKMVNSGDSVYSKNLYDSYENILFRVFRTPDTNRLSISFKIPTGSNLQHGTCRAVTKHTSGFLNNDVTSTTTTDIHTYVDTDVTGAVPGNEVEINLKTATSSANAEGVIDCDVIYYNDYNSERRNVTINVKINYKSSYIQGAVAFYSFGKVRYEQYYETL